MLSQQTSFTYKGINTFPEKYIPSFLLPRPHTLIPVPAFDMSYQPPSCAFSAPLLHTWGNAMVSPSLFIAHAISMTSQRRILHAYFTNAVNLTSEELIRYSAFTLLAVRQFISGSLINLDSPPSCRTRNNLGFFLKVPPFCLHSVFLKDAETPREQYGISQTDFKNFIFKKTSNDDFYLDQSRIHLSPLEVLQYSTSTYNEITFIPRTLHPQTSIEIEGMFFKEKEFNMEIEDEKGDPSSITFYKEIAMTMAEDLKLPLYFL